MFLARLNCDYGIVVTIPKAHTTFQPRWCFLKEWGISSITYRSWRCRDDKGRGILGTGMHPAARP